MQSNFGSRAALTRFILSAAAGLILLPVSCIYLKGGETEPAPERRIRDLSFFPLNRERFRLSEQKSAAAIVFVMRERDCPISEKYGPRWKKLEEEYAAQGVRFIYLYVGRVRPKEAAAQDLKRFGFRGPYSLDLKQTAINALKAETTGDAFILDPKSGKILYKGPLDDQHHLLRSGVRPKNHYVKNILDKILKGEEISPQSIPAPGCIISRPILKKTLFF